MSVVRRVPPALRPRTPLGPFTFISIDYHVATARDAGATLRALGHRLTDLSLSGACARAGTCAEGLKAIDQNTGFTLCPRPHARRRAFFRAYRGSALVRGADAFICSHPAAMCELFLPFARALWVVATTNLELARENPTRWAAWVQTVRRLGADPRAVVAANSQYDRAYVRHFTGVDPVYLPTLASYVDAAYAPARAEVLLAQTHGQAATRHMERIRRAFAAAGVPAAPLRSLYSDYALADLARHPALVVVPYTKSVMSFFEVYRMGVPVFCPSLELLTNWEVYERAMLERVYWSQTPGGAPGAPGPNDRRNHTAVAAWLALADFYTFPHVQHFSSPEDLARQLRAATPAALRAVSDAMLRHAAALEDETRAAWERELARTCGPGRRPVPEDMDAELLARWGETLSPIEPDCHRRSAPDQGIWA